MEQIQSQEQWVLRRLEKFYAVPENLNKMKDVLLGNSSLSLRIIDWFVTNYAKKYNVSIITTKKKHIIVYLSYKSHLKAYSKKMFDPFCRCKRIKFQDIDTTVGQLNFFEWIISDEILEYIEKNKEKIQTDMETIIHERDVSKRRHELSVSATNTITKHDILVKVSFD
jgi:hypothetical protein